MMISKEQLERELEFRTSRSSGPGGQGVNKTETRVEAILNIGSCSALDEDQKSRLRENLSSRINSSDELVVAAQDYRSQLSNKQLAVHRLLAIIEGALTVHKPRISTKPSRSSKRKRREAKTLRSAIKKNRGWSLRNGGRDD